MPLVDFISADQRWTLAALAAVGVAVGGAVAYWTLRGRRDQKPTVPEQNTVVGKVKRMVIYPLKSARGIELQSAKCLLKGLTHDRRWVVMNTASEQAPEGTVGLCLTLLNAPNLALIQPSLEESESDGRVTLILEADGRDVIRIPEPDVGGERVAIRVLRMAGEGIDCGDEAAAWLAELTGKPGARLYYMHDDVKARRTEEDTTWSDRGRPGQETSFSCFSPFMLTTEQSLTDLCSRVGQQLEMARFRPNIIVDCSSPGPYQEDHWRSFSISGVNFYIMKKCGRCPMTTIDPNTGERTGPEPLSKLKEYRLTDSDSRHTAPIFGIQVGSHNVGEIAVGDDVIIM